MRQTITAISFGDRVHTTRGSAGRIDSLLLDRHRRQVHAVVLRRGLMYAAHVLPAEAVVPEHEPDGQVQLHAAMPERPAPLPRRYSLDDIGAALKEQSSPSHASTSWTGEADGVVLRAGQPLYGPDGYVGSLKRLILRWPGYQLVALVVCIGWLRRRCVRIPLPSIVGWAGEQIHISLGRADVQTLPDYRSDGAIRSAIHTALQKDDAIRRVDGEMIAVQVSDGCVTLAGHVADGRNGARAETLARTVPGVRRVTNEVITDAELTQDVAYALTHIEPASRAAVGFSIRHGAVRLFGAVPDAQVRFAIETVVADVPNVRLIVNAITSPDTPEFAADQRIVQPRRGQNVFARDGYVGRIERVIVDPRLRQVTAVVVDARAQRADHDWLGDAPLRRRMHLVPVCAIASVSPVEVFLTLDSHAVAQAAAFRPEVHAAPPAGWQPPFPYQREELVFEAHVAHAVVQRHSIASDLPSIMPSRRVRVDNSIHAV